MNENTQRKIEEFFSAYPVRRYKKGQILILAGETTNYAYYLVDGKMKVYDVSYRGEEIIINNIKPLAFFPVSLIINSTTTRYIYEASTDISVRQAPADLALNFLRSNPPVVYDLLSYLYNVLDDVLDRMVHFVTGSAKQRLIYAIIVECRNFGEPVSGGGHKISITERELGARAGLSRETVSREARVLKITKLIEVHHNYMIVPSVEKLARYLEKR